MESLAKEILNYIGNIHTKVERKQGFMGHYYSPLIDAIYIAEDFENTKMPVGTENINKKAAELIMVCHECVHSTQSKSQHVLNTLFANLSIILTVICAFIAAFGESPLWFKMVTAVVLLASIIIRLMLEIRAINGSTDLAKELVDKGLVDNVSDKDIQDGIEYIKKHKLFVLTQMILDKIILLVVLTIIK